MPNVAFSLTNVAQSVSRPIIFDIIGQVQNITAIPKDSKIYYPGDIDKMQSSGTSIEDTSKLPNFNTGRKTFIEVESDYDPDGVATTATTQVEHLPIFNDEKLGVRLTPIYSSDKVTINFKYMTHSKGEALRWRDDVRMRISMLRDIQLHSLSYHYILNKELVYLLKEIHDKREGYLGYGDSFEQYITSYGSNRLTITSDLVANNVELSVAETQARIIGMFNFDAAPEKPQREDTGLWTISFSYNFTYDRPIGCSIKYPVMVHNQLLHEDYTKFYNNAYRLDNVSKVFSKSFYAMNAFESDSAMNTRMNPNLEIRIPSFDDFVLKSKLPGTGTVWTALCEVDTVDKKSLLNIKELGDVSIDSDIMQFILESEYPYVCKDFQSIIQLSLYREDYLASSDSMTLDAQGNLKSNKELDLRSIHRVRFSIVTDLSKLSKEAIDRLRKYPEAFKKIIGAILELIRNHPDLLKISNKVSLLEFDAIYGLITGNPWTGGHYANTVNNWPYNKDSSYLFGDIPRSVIEYWRRNRVAMNTVMITGIVSLKETNK